jgi:hypothetical protein
VRLAVGEVIAKPSLTISAKPVGVGAVCQQSIRGEGQSGLLTHRDDGKRFVVLADEKLTAFMELELAISRRAVLGSREKGLCFKPPTAYV